MEPADREKLVDSFVTTGMGRDRARLVVDLGVKAAEDAISALVTTADLVGDPTGSISAQSVALQLVDHECRLRLGIMRLVADKNGLPQGRVQL